MLYEFHIDTVKDNDEALMSVTGLQEAGFELYNSAGTFSGGVMLFFRRPKVMGQPPLNGHAREKIVAAARGKKR